MKTHRNKYPLRKVMSSVIGEPWMVILECGHEAVASSDMIGPTCPVRQRCRLCYEDALKQAGANYVIGKMKGEE